MSHSRRESMTYSRPGGKVGRRAMLRGAGGLLLGLPFLPTLETRASAANSGIPRRLITFYTSNGFELSNRPVSKDLSKTNLEALAPFRDRVTTISGMSHESVKADPEGGDGAHYINWAHCAVGDNAVRGSSSGRVAGAISYDQVAGEKISEDWQVKSLNQGGPSWRGSGVPAFGGQYNPKAVWESLFMGFSAKGDDSAEMLAEQRRLEQRSVLDFALRSLQDLKCELGSEDRVRLESHIQDVRDLERRVDAAPTGPVSEGCSAPAQPRVYGWDEFKNNRRKFYQEFHDLKVELTVMAMACDLIRVGTIGFGAPAGGEVPESVDVDESHHELSHKSGAPERASIRTIDRYSASQFAHLLARLDAIVAPGGTTLLDHCAILWLSEGGPGGGLVSGGHGANGLEYVVAGGAGGRLNGGQHLQYDGFAHNNLLLELINAVVPDGVAPLKTFGNPAVCDDGVPAIRA